MTERKIQYRMRISEVADGYVICDGSFPTADGKGTHQLLYAVVHLVDLKPAAKPKVGDTVIRYDDGVHEHQPAAKGSDGRREGA